MWSEILWEYISIHSLVKRETGFASTKADELTISIHSLVKRETANPPAKRQADSNFNPLPRKEGDCKTQITQTATGDFNPLPRKEGDDVLVWLDANSYISIHSLVKRETVHNAVVRRFELNISIHSLVKRETIIGEHGTKSEEFQSTPS